MPKLRILICPADGGLISSRAEGFTRLDLLGQFKADFNLIKKTLKEISRSRRTPPLFWRTKRTQTDDDLDELLSLVSTIIKEFGKLEWLEEQYPHLACCDKINERIRSMRQLEKRLRDQVVDKLKDHMTSGDLEVDYKGLAQAIEKIYNEAMGLYRSAYGLDGVSEDTD